MKARTIAFTLAVLVLLAGCQKSESPPPAAGTQPKPAVPPPPPPAPETTLGKLVKVERSDHTLVHVLSLTRTGPIMTVPGFLEHMLSFESTGPSGWSDKDEKAGKGKMFVALHFEGKPRKPLPAMELPTMFPILFRETSSAIIMATVYDGTWLTDSAGKKYKNGLPVMKKDTRQLAYEIPADTQGLVWHAGKQHFQLEPHPLEVAEAAKPAAPVKQ